MAIFPEERLRARRRLTERAIALAMASRWEEAAKVNRELLELVPDDVDAQNRIGKALTELGASVKRRMLTVERPLWTRPTSSQSRTFKGSPSWQRSNQRRPRRIAWTLPSS